MQEKISNAIQAPTYSKPSLLREITKAESDYTKGIYTEDDYTSMRFQIIWNRLYPILKECSVELQQEICRFHAAWK